MKIQGIWAVILIGALVFAPICYAEETEWEKVTVEPLNDGGMIESRETDSDVTLEISEEVPDDVVRLFYILQVCKNLEEVDSPCLSHLYGMLEGHKAFWQRASDGFELEYKVAYALVDRYWDDKQNVEIWLWFNETPHYEICILLESEEAYLEEGVYKDTAWEAYQEAKIAAIDLYVSFDAVAKEYDQEVACRESCNLYRAKR